jgi:hypothetical protein
VGVALWASSAILGPTHDALPLAGAVALGTIAFALTLPLSCPEIVERIASGSARYGITGRFLVPLQGAPLRYFHGALFVPYRRRDRLARWLPPAVGVRLVLEKRVRETDPMRGALGAPAAELLRDTPALARSGLRPIVLHDPPAADRGQLVALLFAEGDEHPVAVLKQRPLGTGAPALRHEWDRLCAAAALAPDLRASIPCPLAYRTDGRTELMLLSALPGRSAYAEVRSAVRPQRCLRDHFEQAASWLARFHASTRRAGTPASSSGGALAACAAHGDFWARNLLFQDGRLTGVVDWEHGRDEAPVYEDLFHFPLTYGLHYPWSRRRPVPSEDAFRLAFLADNALSRAVTRYFRRYCTDTELSPAVLPSLFETYLTTCASPRAGHEPGLWSRLHAMVAREEPLVFTRVVADGPRPLQPVRAGA